MSREDFSQPHEGPHDLEKRHDRQFTQVFTVLRELLEAPEAPGPPVRKRIGFGEGA